MTKKQCSLEDESWEMLMRTSYFKETLDMEPTKRIIHNGTKHKTEGLFLMIFDRAFVNLEM